MRSLKKGMAVLIAGIMTMAAFAVPAMAESNADMTYTKPSGYSSTSYDSDITQRKYEYADDTVTITRSDGSTSKGAAQIYVSGNNWGMNKDIFPGENLTSVRDKTEKQWKDAIAQYAKDPNCTASFKTISNQYEFLHSKLENQVGDQTVYWDIYIYIDANGNRYGFSYYSLNSAKPNQSDFDAMMKTVSFKYPAKSGGSSSSNKPSSSDVIKIYVDGTQVYPDADPFITNGRTMVPIRVIAEALGYNVGWDAPSKCITLTKGNYDVQMMIDSTWLTKYKNGQVSEYGQMDVVPCIRSSRTFIPLRAAAEAMGCSVDWDNNTKSVFITGNGAMG